MFVLITDLNRNICSAPRQPVTVTEHRLHHFLSSAEPDSYRCSAPQLQTIICRGIQVNCQHRNDQNYRCSYSPVQAALDPATTAEEKVDATPVGHTPVTTQAFGRDVFFQDQHRIHSQLSSCESTQHSTRPRSKFAQHCRFTMLFCSSVCSKTLCSLGRSQSGPKESVMQHSSMSAPNMPLCLAGTTHNQQDWSHSQQDWSAEQIRQSFAKQHLRPGCLTSSGTWVEFVFETF